MASSGDGLMQALRVLSLWAFFYSQFVQLVVEQLQYGPVLVI